MLLRKIYGHPRKRQKPRFPKEARLLFVHLGYSSVSLAELEVTVLPYASFTLQRMLRLS